jgi:molybdate transport system regulatory protein
MSDQGEFMSVSARNQLSGTVSAVAKGAVNDEVEITLPGGEKLVAIVTVQSQQSLGLVAGKEAVALIKAPWVILASEDCGLRFSARNQFAGEVSAVEQGAVNSTVHIKTDAGFKLTSVITNESLQDMALKNGARVIALVKASSVLLAVRA